MSSPREIVDSGDQSLEFAPTIGTGMQRVPAGAGAEFDPETVEQLQNRLDEFDAVRMRGKVESRSVHLGGQPPR